jgi:hypothetical protein
LLLFLLHCNLLITTPPDLPRRRHDEDHGGGGGRRGAPRTTTGRPTKIPTKATASPCSQGGCGVVMTQNDGDTGETTGRRDDDDNYEEDGTTTRRRGTGERGTRDRQPTTTPTRQTTTTQGQAENNRPYDGDHQHRKAPVDDATNEGEGRHRLPSRVCFFFSFSNILINLYSNWGSYYTPTPTRHPSNPNANPTRTTDKRGTTRTTRQQWRHSTE